MQLYRQMGGVRDDLTIHEKALDVLIELLKKEQVGVANKYFHLHDDGVKLLCSIYPCPPPCSLMKVSHCMESTRLLAILR